MSQDEFTKLFLYMEKRFDAIEKALEHKADKPTVDRIHTILDGLALRFATDDIERAVIMHQLDIHEQWFSQLAATTGVRLGR